MTLGLALSLAGEASAAADAEPPAAGRSTWSRWLGGDGASGGWLGGRQRLAARGVQPYAVWTGDVLRNFDGGLRRGTDWVGLLAFGTDVDLEAAFGLRGAGVHASALWVQADEDDGLAGFVGDFDELDEIAARKDLRLHRLYFEHAPGGELLYQLGQLVLDDHFMVSDAAALFINGNFGALPVQSANVPAPIYPVAALGGRVQWAPRPHVSLQIGVYDGDAGTQDSNQTGFDHEWSHAEGVAVFAEVALESSPWGRDATAKLGGFYHSGRFVDFDSGRSVWGHYALYAVLDWVLSGTRERSGLSAFVRGGWTSLDDRSPVDAYLDLGVTGRGLRADDRVGLAYSHAVFGGPFVSSRRRAGSPIHDAESALELTYRAQLTPWLALQPDLQLVIDPQDARASDALVGGVRVEITF